jgi:hypothetical protein
MWLLYVSCAWVAGVFLGSKVSLPLLALSLGLIPFAYSEHSKTGTAAHLIRGARTLCLTPILDATFSCENSSSIAPKRRAVS